MRILNFGSLNIDHVYAVEHIARPGETVTSRAYQLHAGGKGANQSVALARAGAPVWHAGRVGPEGRWLLDRLRQAGVDVDLVCVGSEPTGHALIQVEASGQNSIVLFPGANHAVDEAQVEATMGRFSEGDILLLQNEISCLTYILRTARDQGLRICLNPAPFTPEVLACPLQCVDLLVANESEAMGLVGGAPGDPDLIRALAARFPEAAVVLTLGARGAVHCWRGVETRVPAVPVQAVDTTAAGDTFIGYFLWGWAGGAPVRRCLERAARAAAVCVTRSGAMDSIPTAAQVGGDS
ncbi:MAG: ribokinase [Candidatus Latescibacterota bacterium]